MEMRQIPRSKFYYFKASWKFSVLIYRAYDMPVKSSSNLIFQRRQKLNLKISPPFGWAGK